MIDLVQLYGRARYAARDTLLGELRDVLPGLRDSIAFVDPLWTGTLWTRVVLHGIASCDGNHISINTPLAVEAGAGELALSVSRLASLVATIRCQLPIAADTRLEVLDVAGRQVVELFAGVAGPGALEQRWYAVRSPPGVYFVRLRQGSAQRSARLVLMR